MLIKNLILGHLTLLDDGETVLIQDYGLTAYVCWNPSRMEQRNGRIASKGSATCWEPRQEVFGMRQK
jgi:hypothetical protein